MLSFFSTPSADTHVSQLASGSAPHTKSSLDQSYHHKLHQILAAF
jgi:hypothetical protein